MIDNRHKKHEMKRERKTVSFRKDKDADLLAWVEAQNTEFSLLMKQLIRERIDAGD